MTDEKKTGTDDVTYNLISVLYHTLKEAETVEKYIDDAQQTGDENLVRFFRHLQEEDRRRGDQAKQLLGSMLGTH
jgi:FtsZ-binding cell division protein ZapB